MTKFVLYIAATLDGYIASKNGGVEWLDSMKHDEYGYEHFFTKVDSLVMGSKTYEQILNNWAWPYGDKLTYVITKKKNLKKASSNVFFFNKDLTKLLTEKKLQDKKYT
jgi:dihydrofolate reductase